MHSNHCTQQLKLLSKYVEADLDGISFAIKVGVVVNAQTMYGLMVGGRVTGRTGGNTCPFGGRIQRPYGCLVH